jgi:hypothetical protein
MARIAATTPALFTLEKLAHDRCRLRCVFSIQDCWNWVLRQKEIGLISYDSVSNGLEVIFFLLGNGKSCPGTEVTGQIPD